MNEAGLLLAWCAAQVTLVALVAAAIYSLVRRFCPAAGAGAALASLGFLTLLGLLALSRWPNWIAVTRSHLERLEAQDQWSGQAISSVASDAIEERKERPATPGSAPTESSQTPRVEVSPSDERWDAAPVHPQAPVAAQSWGRFWIALREMGYKPQDGAWQWPATLAVVFLLGAALAILRLGAGLACLAIYPCIGRPLRDPELLSLVESLRREFGCRRRVMLRESTALTSAATIGWLRPLVLLPPQWREWTLSERQAVLAHEMAHVVRGDFLTWLAAQFALALHFYHPLAHWLVRCLRVEQELAADAAAARASGGRGVYLTILAGLALREGNRSPHWLAASFLPERGALWRRVEALRSPAPRFSAASVVATQMLVFAALAVTTLGAMGLRPLQTAQEELDRVEQIEPAPLAPRR